MSISLIYLQSDLRSTLKKVSFWIKNKVECIKKQKQKNASCKTNYLDYKSERKYYITDNNEIYKKEPIADNLSNRVIFLYMYEI